MSRIIYIFLVIVSYIFSSFYGGYIPELIRYTLIFMPVMMFAYVCVVYIRMKAGQGINTENIIRGQEADYYLNIDNSGIIPYSNLRLVYYEGVSDINKGSDMDVISLMPGERYKYERKLVCRYAGTYNVGVRAVYIYDYLGLFKIKYRLRRQIRVHVKPEEIDIENLSPLLAGGINRRSMNESSHISNGVIGSSIRDYIPGDSPKRIHWKNSARLGKLVTRQGEDDYEESTILVIDTSLGAGGLLDRIVIADRMLHITVAIARYYVRENINYRIVYSNDNRLYSYYVSSEEEYREFYEGCENINFTEPVEIAEYVSDITDGYAGQPLNIIIISGGRRNNRLSFCDNKVSEGHRIAVINVVTDERDNIDGNGSYDVINIHADDNICEVLSE